MQASCRICPSSTSTVEIARPILHVLQHLEGLVHHSLMVEAGRSILTHHCGLVQVVVPPSFALLLLLLLLLR